MTTQSPPAVPVRTKNPVREPQQTRDDVTDWSDLTCYLNDAVKMGLKFYSDKIVEAINRKEPLTENGFKGIHDDIKAKVLETFTTTFAVLEANGYTKEITAAKNKLVSEIQSQWIVSLTRFYNEIEDVLKIVKECTDNADVYFDNQFDAFIHATPRAKQADMEQQYERLKKETLTEFKGLMKTKNMEIHTSFCIEIEKRLQDKLQDTLELCTESDYQDTSSDTDEDVYTLINLTPPEPDSSDMTQPENSSFSIATTTETTFTDRNNELHISSMQHRDLPTANLIDLNTLKPSIYPKTAEGSSIPAIKNPENSQNTSDRVLLPFDLEYHEQSAQPNYNNENIEGSFSVLPIVQNEPVQANKKKKAPPPPPSKVMVEHTNASQLSQRRTSNSSNTSTSSIDQWKARKTPDPNFAQFGAKKLAESDNSPAVPPRINYVVPKPGQIKDDVKNLLNADANGVQEVRPKLPRNPGLSGRSSNASNPGITSFVGMVLNVGIYIDEDIVQIGSSDQTGNAIQILHTQPNPIYLTFSDAEVGTAPVKLGFNIFNLIKASNSRMEISGIRKSMKTAKLLSNIFKKMIEKIYQTTSALSVGEVVVTTSFSLTSAEKERLKNALSTTGCQTIRIFTSLMSSALALRKSVANQLKAGERKQFLMFNSHSQNFSIGVVEMTKYKMVTRSFHDSRNIQNASGEFQTSYLKLVRDGEDHPDVKRVVREVVEKAWKYVLKEIPRGAIQEIVFTNVKLGSPLSAIVEEFFIGNSENALHIHRLELEPLLGVCHFASKDKLLQDGQFEVLDSHRPKLMLIVNSKVEKQVSKRHPVKKGFVFCHFVSLPLKENTVILQEKYHSESKDSYTICGYSIICSEECSGKESNASIHCRMDNDGAYSMLIDFDTSVIKREIFRHDSLEVTDEPQSSSSGFRNTLNFPKFKRVSKFVNRAVSRASSFRVGDNLHSGVAK
ncbi:unnamed protein product [Allacma fusca]|uniref:Uncharacterized protein n=1 Tax=Allacma fusca TaxID=39272 RepID=A0A8J2JHQ9_9HEXA|nr:unnamed protein product [Allacma fusca]